MIAIPTACPDCATPLTVTRELPDEEAMVHPQPCAGCGRAWSAAILQWRQADGRLVLQARLHPVPRRLRQSIRGRGVLTRNT